MDAFQNVMSMLPQVVTDTMAAPDFWNFWFPLLYVTVVPFANIWIAMARCTADGLEPLP